MSKLRDRLVSMEHSFEMGDASGWKARDIRELIEAYDEEHPIKDVAKLSLPEITDEILDAAWSVSSSDKMSPKFNAVKHDVYVLLEAALKVTENQCECRRDNDAEPSDK